MSKNKNNFIFITIFRLLIIAIAFLGLFSNGRESNLNDLWYFTIQTNIFVVFLMCLMIIADLLKLLNFKINNKFLTFLYYIRLFITIYITITGIIFCFVLIPVALVTKTSAISNIYYRDILLHVFVPVMALIDYFTIGEKILMKKTAIFYFLLYPIFYECLIITIPIITNQTATDVAYYPYFFLDPTFNNQGYVAVIKYSLLCLLLFSLLGLLFIYFNNKCAKSGTKKENH